MVYYRKYRPQKISELDLPTVREKLTAILSSNSLPHAFLFTGSKGLGKTSSARILAKAINCEVRNTDSRLRITEKKVPKIQKSEIRNPASSIEPCNQCMACVSITNGSNIDVLEIDAASNGGVEEMRSLRERVKFASSSLKYKVYIIDEVHMLSSGAFNALLKTLEEPPSHVIFILATTELHKLPATVVSRTFQIQFEKPTIEQMAQSLSRIVEGEDLKVEDGVLERVSEISDGAFRDASKNLEELVLASEGKKITIDLFEKVFRSHGMSGQITDLLIAYSKRDPKKSLEIIQDLTSQGADFKIVIEQLVDHLRGLLMLRNGIKSEVKDIKELNLVNINDLLELANEAYTEIKLSVIPQLPLELMTVKYCILDAEIVASSEQPAASEYSSREQSESRSTNETSSRQARTIEEKNPVIARSETTKQSSDLHSSSPIHQSTSNNLLRDLIFEVNKINKPAAALLRSAKTAEIIGDELVITTPFPIHAERLRSEKVLPDLLKSAEIVTKSRVGVVIETI